MLYPAKLRRPLKLACLAAAVLVFAVSCLRQGDAEKKLTLTGANTYAPPPVIEVSDKTYDKFSHEVPEHSAIACDSCHARDAGNPAKLQFPGHDSCTSSHLSEFTDTASAMCSICHNDLKKVPAVMKAFPARFNEGFNMRFDHDAHTRGAARPPNGCASCHAPAGAGRSIPAGLAAHTGCFTCHTPESTIGSCNTCHQIAPYTRTVPARATFAAFRHSDHTGRVSCAECHNVRPGATQGRQVASPVAAEHFPSPDISCRTCHNDRRAFGEADFVNCKRCHTGTGFDMLP